MNEIYLLIAGFYIQIDFGEYSASGDFDYLGKYSKNRIRGEIISMFGDFLELSKPRRVDFTIKFDDGLDEQYVELKSGSKKYVPLLRYISKTEVISYTQISISQFTLVIKDVLSRLLERGGFFLHASAVNVKSSAYLFLGSSGAGKSTTADILRGKYPILADDILIVRRIRNSLYLYQTPFIEKSWWVKKTKSGYKIEKIFLLNKSTEYKSVRVKNLRKLADTIAPQILSETQKLEKVKNLLKLTSIYELHSGLNSEKLIEVLKIN